MSAAALAYASCRDTDQRLAILASADVEGSEFLRQLEAVHCIDDEALSLVKAFFDVDDIDDEGWTPEPLCCVGVEESKTPCVTASPDDATLVNHVRRVEEVCATVFGCLAVDGRLPRWRAEAALHTGRANVAISEDSLDESQFADLVLAACDCFGDVDLDAMAAHALQAKFAASTCPLPPPTQPISRVDAHHASNPILRFDAHHASKRAAAVRAGRKFGEPSFAIASDWRDRLRAADGVYGPRVPPDPGGGPCLVGVDFDGLDDLIGPP